MTELTFTPQFAVKRAQGLYFILSQHAIFGRTVLFCSNSTLIHITELLYHNNEINPLHAELNPICHLLALLGAHPILHISRIRVNPLNTELNPICQ